MRNLWLCIILSLVLIGCGGKPSIPREYGYFRIPIPDEHHYVPANLPDYPYSFVMADCAYVEDVSQDGDKYWLNIVYPQWNAIVHCSYKPVQSNFPLLVDDALEFVYSHACKASAIPEREYADPEHHVYGIAFDLEGNTATPMQFFLTDSTHHFFRGSLYFNTIPNQDSLAPVIGYIREDMIALIESFRWAKGNY